MKKILMVLAVLLIGMSPIFAQEVQAPTDVPQVQEAITQVQIPVEFQHSYTLYEFTTDGTTFNPSDPVIVLNVTENAIEIAGDVTMNIADIQYNQEHGYYVITFTEYDSIFVYYPEENFLIVCDANGQPQIGFHTK